MYIDVALDLRQDRLRQGIVVVVPLLERLQFCGICLELIDKVNLELQINSMTHDVDDRIGLLSLLSNEKIRQQRKQPEQRRHTCKGAHYRDSWHSSSLACGSEMRSLSSLTNEMDRPVPGRPREAVL